VNPVFGIKVIVAVYVAPCAKDETVGDQETVPVNCSVAVTVSTGVAPATGGVTPSIAIKLIGAGAVRKKTAVIEPESATFVADACSTVKKSAGTPVVVQPLFGVSVIVAV